MTGFIFEDLDFKYCYDLAQRKPEIFLRTYYKNVRIFPGIFPNLEDAIRHLVLSDNRFSTLDWDFFTGKQYDISKLGRLLSLNNFDKEDIQRFKTVFKNTTESFEF